MLEIHAKSRLLDAMLESVPFDGWTEKTLGQAAESCEISPVTVTMLFPDGVGDVIDFFLQESDRKMVEAIENLPLSEMKLRERIMAAVRIRLEQWQQHKSAIHRALAYHTLHAAAGTRCLWRTVDALWYAVGDHSTDYNYYTKRLTLSLVYSSTLLFWLDDVSEDHADTWAFLDRRIENVLAFGKFTGALKKKFRF